LTIFQNPIPGKVVETLLENLAKYYWH